MQNRVAIAVPRLPQEVQRLGIVTRKTSPDFLMVVNLMSPNHSLDRGYISNYALTQVRDRIARLDGVGDARLFGARDYAMRVWIDPEQGGRARPHRRRDRPRFARRTFRSPPAHSASRPTPRAAHSSSTSRRRAGSPIPQQFANVVIRTDADGRQVRVSDVARVELGAADYSTNTYLSGDRR